MPLPSSCRRHAPGQDRPRPASRRHRPGNRTERYTVKRYKSEKAKEGDSWRHVKITLKPVNPDFEPIVLTGADEGELQVIAELVKVLGG